MEILSTRSRLTRNHSPKSRHNSSWLRQNFEHSQGKKRPTVSHVYFAKKPKRQILIVRPQWGHSKGPRKKMCDHPWQLITFDYVGPFPTSGKGRNTCILIVTDVFTKFVLIQSFRQASTLVQFLEQSVFLLFGVPEMILTDNGPLFTSKELCRNLSILK